MIDIKFFNHWNDYIPIINKVKQTRIQANLFPGRENAINNYKNAVRELFIKYENNYNGNNEIQSMVIYSVFDKIFKKYFPEITSEIIVEMENEIISEEKIMVITIKNIIQNHLSKTNLSYSRIEESFHLLIHEIVKLSNRYTHFPITDKNIDVFIDSTPTYLDRELSEQDYFNSPIEEILYNALTPLCSKHNLILKTEYTVRDKGRIEIRYALDFAILDNEKVILNIETDGLNFHQSFQAMALDRQRDRWLLLRDIPVMRFTSKEIFSNLNNCIIEIETFINNYKKKNKTED